QRHHVAEHQNYLQGHSLSSEQQFCGEIVAVADGQAEILAKNKFRVGDRVEVIRPEGNREMVIETMTDLHGRPADEAPGGGHRVRIPWPDGLPKLGLLARYLRA
ncbi:MAG TPA: U32 family peptidase, partial [Gammaproteobacteria bacterium]|nr:U32 family peptidase [Gammaproteobacteria bacterium]